MFMKASEIQTQLASYRDTVAKKKKVIEFSHCFTCKGPLDFEHALDMKREFMVEKCSCPTCGVKAADRRFRVQ